jgi:hypothetical protein
MKRMTLRMGVGVVAACAAFAAGISAFVVTNDGATAATAPSPSIGPVSSGQPGGLDAATLKGVQALNRKGVGATLLGQRLISDARTLPTRVDGYQLYLVPTQTGKLCLGLGNSLEEWFDPLSQTHPVLFAATDRDGPGGVEPTVYGVAIDGVRTVTFTIDGAQRSVPVTGNVFEFHGDSDSEFDSIAPISATFSNGTEQPLK